jgi:hypothetical protein
MAELRVFAGLDELGAAVGQHLGYSDWHTITQDQINTFADATGEFTVADPSAATLGIVSLGIDVARWYSENKQWSPEYVAEQYREMALRIVGVRPS